MRVAPIHTLGHIEQNVRIVIWKQPSMADDERRRPIDAFDGIMELILFEDSSFDSALDARAITEAASDYYWHICSMLRGAGRA